MKLFIFILTITSFANIASAEQKPSKKINPYGTFCTKDLLKDGVQPTVYTQPAPKAKKTYSGAFNPDGQS